MNVEAAPLTARPLARTRSTRMLIEGAMAEHMRAELVCDAFEMAMAQRLYPDGILFHSDRGSQYAGTQFRTLLGTHAAAASMRDAGAATTTPSLSRSGPISRNNTIHA